MANHKIMLLRPSPGIQRDGTQFDSTGYIDGEWVRFYKGKPRKIGGHLLILMVNLKHLYLLMLLQMLTT